MSANKNTAAAGGKVPYELLSPEDVERSARDVPAWSLRGKEIIRVFRFKDFAGSMAFVNEVARLAEAEDHHPDIFISYDRVVLTLSTHKVGGLTRRDFLLAALIDKAAPEEPAPGGSAAR